MTDHDAIAAKVRQDRRAGTPGPWKQGKSNPARVSREGRYIANFDPLHSNAPICETDARRAAFHPDLEAAYLDLYDEVRRLKSERLYIVGWNAGWDEAQYQAEHGRPSDGDITPKYEFTAAEMAAVDTERDALRVALVEHNDLLRSAIQIAKREGIDGQIASTNWDAYYNRVSVILKRHHAISNTARAALKGDSDE